LVHEQYLDDGAAAVHQQVPPPRGPHRRAGGRAGQDPRAETRTAPAARQTRDHLADQGAGRTERGRAGHTSTQRTPAGPAPATAGEQAATGQASHPGEEAPLTACAGSTNTPKESHSVSD